MVGNASPTTAAAAEHGVAVDEVQKMLAAFWQQADHISPVERRVEVLRRHWAEFDHLHAEQDQGKPALWGLLQEHAYLHLGAGLPEHANGPIQALHQQLLSPQLNADIEELWGVKMVPRWPDRLITQNAPHVTVNELGGAALRLWQGVGLTAWFLIEGPYSRTDLPGMRDYYRNEIQALSEVGTPADDGIFADLAATEGGRSNPTFAQMRDIITPYRRVWMERFLDIHLRNAWEGTLRKTAVAYHRHIAEKSKAPTAEAIRFHRRRRRQSLVRRQSGRRGRRPRRRRPARSDPVSARDAEGPGAVRDPPVRAAEWRSVHIAPVLEGGRKSA